MTKKHLITSLGMLGLLLTAKLFIFGTPAADDCFKIVPEDSSKQEILLDNYLQNLSFASEKFPIHDQRVIRKMKASLRAHSFERLQTSRLHYKAEKWFPIIEPILIEHGIPLDFKYIPLVESGLKSGTSPKGAKGFWQFMPNTAREFGLKVNTKIDERHDMEKSTVAAAKYLKALYNEFGSWTLVAAAYNIGEGGLRKHMRNQKENDYFKIKLNRETASYVYKLISMKEIIENPTRHGFASRADIVLAQLNNSSKPYFPFEMRIASNTPQVLIN